MFIFSEHMPSISETTFTEGPEMKKARFSDPFAALRDQPGGPDQQEVDINELSCTAELNNYKTLVHVQSVGKNNPLHFWKQQQADFPILAETARRSTVGTRLHTVTDRIDLQHDTFDFVQCAISMF
jgi:hypothetical protein